jgi:hypothetical protein
VRTRNVLAAAPIFAAGILLGSPAVSETLHTTVVAQGGKSDSSPNPAPAFTPEQLAERAQHRRAVEAVIWGMPAVNYERMLQAAISNGAKLNQVIFWSRPVNWKNQTLTPKPSRG